jgi:hypothetical protein
MQSASSSPTNSMETSSNTTTESQDLPPVIARFEFEPGSSNGTDGTKILMLEWEVSQNEIDTVEWDEKNMYPTSLLSHSSTNSSQPRKFYYLLPPGTTVPRQITISKRGGSGESLYITPLPAIFPAELNDVAHSAGKKGVLHTIWAKSRLATLQREIDEESRSNTEGIGLEMGLQEKTWIEQNFGVGAGARRTQRKTRVAAPTSISSPISPTGGGGRLAEKLKGLRVGTSPLDLSGNKMSGHVGGSPLVTPITEVDAHAS